MKETLVTQGTIATILHDAYLLTWVEAFLLDRKTQNLSKGTLEFYRKKLRLFTDFCDGQVINRMDELTPNSLRQFLLYLEEKGHNPGGVHAVYRTLRAFLRWYENEAEPDGWKNPINKVKAPRVQLDPLEPIKLNQVSQLLDTCQKGTFMGDRDRAILLSLLDTGARAQEFLDIQIGDIDIVTGSILIRRGKGRKPRTVYLGTKSRKALRAFLKHREDCLRSLWVTDDFSRQLSYDGLRAIITRRAEAAGIVAPSLHAFRRAFAINMLRAGVDVYSLQELMGHADLQVLRRYLKQTNEDLQIAHRRGSPVDNGL